jgi:hypothetical protein
LDIETKIVYLVKRHSKNAHLQYNGLCDMGPSFKKVNHYEIKVYHELV